MRKEDLTFRLAFSWRWLLILTYGDSRKSGFALWLAMLSTIAFFMNTFYAILASLLKIDHPIVFTQLIDAQTWLLCIGTSATLFGWGTVADRKLELKKMEVQNAFPQPSRAS